MRYLTLLALAVLASCAHGGGRPAICKRPFTNQAIVDQDLAFDLDGSGTVTVRDKGRWFEVCGVEVTQ